MSRFKPLKVGFNYFASFVKPLGQTGTSLRTGIKQDDGSYQNYRLVTWEQPDWLIDGAKFKIVSIDSIEQTEWENPKTKIVEQQFNATVTLAPDEDYQDTQTGYVDQVEEEFGSQSFEIDDSDLPF